MPDLPKPPAASLSSEDRLERVEAKLDKLLANDTDEQVAGILGAVRKVLDRPWVQRGLVVVTVVCALWLLGRMGYLSPAQEQAAKNAVAATVEAAVPELGAAIDAVTNPASEDAPVDSGDAP